nr:unnamed protein product [Callosobruchus chinensis]
MKMLKIQQSYEYSLISFTMKLLRSSTYLKQKLVTRYVIHDLNTRFNCHLCLPWHKTAMFQRSCSYNAVNLINMLSPTMTDHFTKESLKKCTLNNINKRDIVLFGIR